jgi:hypothetical protein
MVVDETSHSPIWEILAMQLALPATRTFAYLCGGAMAGIVLMMIVGDAIEDIAGPEVPPVVRTVFIAVFFALLLVITYSTWALMIRSIIGFQVGFWTRVAAARPSREIASTITRVEPPARKIGDVIILAGWTIWTLGLTIMVPAMIRDGFFS